MAEEIAVSRSRWDAPGFQYVPSNTLPPAVVQSGTGVSAFQQSEEIPVYFHSDYVIGHLISQRQSPNHPEFLECVYGTRDSAGQIVQECLKEFGCCDTTCCSDLSWREKYAWALALIIVFAALVVIAFILWLFIWLFNRAKDKKQKKEMYGSQRPLSPSASQLSLNQTMNSQRGVGGYGYGYNQYLENTRRDNNGYPYNQYVESSRRENYMNSAYSGSYTNAYNPFIEGPRIY
ncbi:hypothetical protein AB6A40_001992 [Gnathostoma spinigerum]|uniref:CX domain-containing protein n=1 Tax=Gnathostoma spinigerum TaxID=75299 RepID=A0ABD6EEJ0_9BILA